LPGSGIDVPAALSRPAPRRALLAALLATLLVACTTTPEPDREPPPPTISIPTALRVGIDEPASIDPARVDSTSGLLVISQAFDGLVATDPESQAPVPATARRWRSLEGGRAFEFTLRSGVTFHDGSAVTAEDFVFAWDRLADPATHSPYAFLLEAVSGYREFHTLRQGSRLTGVQAVDERTLRVDLVRPWTGFPSITAHPALSPVPPSASRLDFDAQPIGNGPYAVSEPWGLGQPILMERYEGYYGDAPSVDRLEFGVFERAEEGWSDFLTGDLDVATVPEPSLAAARTTYGEAGVITLARLLYCGFNLALKPFQDGRLRRAVSLAMDRDQLASGVYGELAVPARAIVPPSIEGHDRGVCGQSCTPDQVEAARLVSGLPEDRRAFELDVISSAAGERLAAALVDQLETVGLEITPRLLDEEAYGGLLQRGRQQAFCLVWDADGATQQGMLEPLLATGSPDNHSKVHSPRIDKALGRGRAARTDAARIEAFAEAERIALEILPVIPVAWFRSHLAVQPYVRGFSLDPLGLFDVSAIELLPEDATPDPGPSAS